MKVVINRCYGGFSLSRSATIVLAATDCPHIQRSEPKDYFGGRPGWEKEFAKDQERSATGLFQRSLIIDGKIVTDEHRNSGRNCPHLAAVVETDPSASGGCASLEVIEIPDGTDFEIDEYDGMESVHETHRRWP